jgi:tripartite-type tricarboxylate transporter receptor subunit TctC
MLTRRRLLALSATTALAPTIFTGPARAQAEGWPNRIVRLVLPFPPGGGADMIGRLVGARLAEVWGQQVVIENRGGAGGNIASEAVARSAPDGYTLYLAGDFLSTNIFLYPKLSYDPVADFAPVSLAVQFPTVIVVPNSSPARSLAEFIAHAKTKGGAFTYASPGHGTSPHLAAELFKRVAGIEMTHVPYRGAGPALQDVIPGRVDSFFNNIAPTVALMKEGQIRGIAVTSGRRSPAMPDLPTIAESGFPDFVVPGWYAFFVPTKTPPEIIRRMHADIATVLAEPAIKGRLEQNGLFVASSTPDEMAAYHKAEMKRWGPLIEQAGIRFRE